MHYSKCLQLLEQLEVIKHSFKQQTFKRLVLHCKHKIVSISVHLDEV